ncbi:MAG: DUF4386 domain-containing protein [bacterium]
MTQRTAALVAGLGLLVMTVLAPLGLLPVEALRRATTEDLAGMVAAGLPGFRWAVLAFIGTAVLDILVAWGLFVAFRAGAEEVMRLAAWLRLVYAGMLAVMVTHLFDAAQIGGMQDAAVAPAIRAALTQFHDGFQMALIFFALHLLALAAALRQGNGVPAWVAAFVALAGIGYLVDGIAYVLLPEMTVKLAIYSFGGELVLAVYLVWQAVRPLARATQ